MILCPLTKCLLAKWYSIKTINLSKEFAYFGLKTFGRRTFDQQNVTQIFGKQSRVFIILCSLTKCLSAKWFKRIVIFWSKTFGQQTFDQLNVTQIVGKETKVFIILCPSTKCLAAKWFLIKNHKTHCLIKNLLANRHLDDRHFAYSVSGQKMCRLVIWPRVAQPTILFLSTKCQLVKLFSTKICGTVQLFKLHRKYYETFCKCS